MILIKYRNVFALTFRAIVLTVGLAQSSCTLLGNRDQRPNDKKANATSAQQGIAIVKFCELLKTPFTYDSQVIQLSTTLGRFRDHLTLYDPNCVPKHPLIKVTPSRSLEYDTQTDFGNKVLQIVSGSEDAKEGKVQVFVSAIGFFKAIPREQRKDFTELQYEFTVTRIENPERNGENTARR
jgi:hypothetical protein